MCEAYNYINGRRFDKVKQHDAKEDVRITYEVYKKIKDGITEILNEENPLGVYEKEDASLEEIEKN